MRTNNGILVTTTNNFEDIPIEKYLNVVSANVVVGTHFFSDFGAALTDLFGGFSSTYQSKLNIIYNEVMEALKKKALNVGGNAIIGLNIDFDEISGKGKSMFMVSAYGTAVLLKRDESENFKSIENNEVSKQELEFQILINAMLSKMEKSYVPDAEDWNLLLSNPNEYVFSKLLDKYIYIQDNNYDIEAVKLFKENFPNYIKSICNPTVVTKIYSKLKENVLYSSLVIDTAIFDPIQIVDLIETGNVKSAVECLIADKDSYTQDDLSKMHEIIQLLENLPNKGSIEPVKQMLTKSKDKYICPNKHINDSESQFCYEFNCQLDIKGLTSEDYRKIKNFKLIIDTLGKLLNIK